MMTDERLRVLRRQIAAEIVRALGPKAQYSVAPAYGIPQARMSNLGCGRVERFSLDWLVRRVHRMGGTIELKVELGDVAAEWAHTRFAARRRVRRFNPGATI